MKSIKTKIIFCMAVLILCSSVIGWGIISLYFSNTMFSNEIDRHKEIIYSHINKIETNLNAIEEYAKTISYNTVIQQDIFNCYGAIGYQRQMGIRDLEEKLRNYVILRPEFIRNMYIVDRDLEGTFSYKNNFESDIKTDWFYEAKESIQTNAHYYSDIREQKTYDPVTCKQVISYMAPIKNLQNNEECIGYIVININVDSFFDDAYKEYEGIKGYYLSDHEDKLVLETRDTDLVYPPQNVSSKNDFFSENQCYFIQRLIPKLSIHLNVVIAEDKIRGLIAKAQMILFAIMGISLILAVVLAFVLGRSITKPIVHLTANMKQAATGDFTVIASVQGKDEITEMSRIFNFMVRKIRGLIQRNEEVNQAQKELMMKIFMSKINPHFIYNTLNSIIYLARKGKSSEIIQMTTAFIHIMRKNIEINERNVTLKEEMNYLNDYIEILKHRYNNLIRLEFEIPEHLLDYKIQPMILYPMVENSVFHGISAKDQEGRILVSVEEENENLRLTVEDDGIGITPDKLLYIRDYLSDESIHEMSGNIGLRNVNDRLKLYYGRESQLQIDSIAEEGTRIEFTIPKKVL